MFNLFKNKKLKYLNRIKEDFEDAGNGKFPERLYSITKKVLLTNKINLPLDIFTHKVLIELTYDFMDGQETHITRGLLSPYGQQINKIFNDSVTYLKGIQYYDAKLENEVRKALSDKIKSLG